MTFAPTFVALVRFGLVALAVAACGTTGAYLSPSGTSTTLVAGWEYRFSLDWTVESEPGPTRRVRGYISSHYGESAEPVRILAQALDASGAIIGQRIEWVVGGVNGFQRAYFQVAQLPPAAAYRVSVWDYTLLQSPGSGWI